MNWKKAAINIGHSKLAVYFIIVMLMTNLDALIDAILHPEIEYWDEEHVIMGGTAGILISVIIYLFHRYTRKLELAYKKIASLEKVLPICSQCKKIRLPGKDPHIQNAWQNIDEYITNNTHSIFSHGICPDCQKKLYNDYLGSGSDELPSIER